MRAERWPEAEQALVGAYQEVADRHNRLGLTEPLDPSPRPFHRRPWLVLDADRFAGACLEAMADRTLAAFQPIGAIDQFVDSTDVVGFRPALCRQIGRVYDLATGPASGRRFGRSLNSAGELSMSQELANDGTSEV